MLPPPAPQFDLRLPLWRGLCVWALSREPVLLVGAYFLDGVTPFFLRIALSAAFWNFCPRRNLILV